MHGVRRTSGEGVWVSGSGRYLSGGGSAFSLASEVTLEVRGA